MCRARTKVCTFGVAAHFCLSSTHIRFRLAYFFLWKSLFIASNTHDFVVMAREMHNRTSVASARLIRRLESRVTLLFESHPREE